MKNHLLNRENKVLHKTFNKLFSIDLYHKYHVVLLLMSIKKLVYI